MEDLLDRALAAIGDLADGLITVAVGLVALFVAYRVAAWLVRSVADRAARAPLPGADPAAEDRAVRLAERRRRLETVASFTLRLVRWGVFAVAAGLVISVLLPGMWTSLGALGVALGVAVGGAVGFGAQQLVRDYLNGVLIMGENPYGVGDVVMVAGIRGTVEEVGLRRTVVRDSDGTVHSVPNGAIVVASNFTRTYARVNERFVVAYGTDIERATAVIDAVGRELAADPAWSTRILETPAVARVDPVLDPGIPIVVAAMVRPGEQWAVAAELRRRALAAFAREGIELASTQRLVAARGGAGPERSAGDAEGGADFS
ncbi:MAG: mechanosensitive ion channel family protein [Chloroflexi bacterium]|jgi:small conductance mechanosensitive channel|nr:mechanosensitive ion channel family protein [Chloroflexota bacterium]